MEWCLIALTVVKETVFFPLKFYLLDYDRNFPSSLKGSITKFLSIYCTIASVLVTLLFILNETKWRLRVYFYSFYILKPTFSFFLLSVKRLVYKNLKERESRRRIKKFFVRVFVLIRLKTIYFSSPCLTKKVRRKREV
jgi:hypothetical protein